MATSRSMDSYLAIASMALLLGGCAPIVVKPTGSRHFDRNMPLEDAAATSANVSIGDVNADGHLDIVLIKGRHWPLVDPVLLGKGDGTFQPPYPLPSEPDRSYSGELVDVDGDGDLDVIVSNDTPDPKIIHVNEGNGRFSLGSTFGRAEWPTRHVRVIDLNRDALPDVVVANRYGPDQGPSYICFGVAGGGFTGSCVAFAQSSTTTISAADFNGDGAPDLAVPHRDGGQSHVYLNDGKGRFPERRPFGPATATIRSAAPSDLNRDGILDIAVIDERTGPAIFWGQADGSYSPPAPLGEAKAMPYAIAVEDLDRNGRPDVIVGYVESHPIVYFNKDDGRFHPEPFGDDEGTAYGFAFGDLDEDGQLDIAVARSDARNMLYFGSTGQR